MSDFVDEDTNPEARVPLHPDVVTWLEDGLKARQFYAARGSVADAEMVPSMEALLEMVRGVCP